MAFESIRNYALSAEYLLKKYASIAQRISVQLCES